MALLLAAPLDRCDSLGGRRLAALRAGYGAGHPSVASDLDGQHDRDQVEGDELLEALDALLPSVCLDRIPDRHTASVRRELTAREWNREVHPASPMSRHGHTATT